MKIAISATGSTLDAEIDPRFGRCQYFIIVDPDTKEFEAMDNSSAMASGGAGISAAQMIAGKGVAAVLTGNCGPNAYQTLSAAGIRVTTGVSGKIRDAVEQYKSGVFTAAQQPNVPDHFGTGFGSGAGPGPGTGRGMGGGRGLGLGMGIGRAMGSGMMARSAMPQPSAGQSLDELKTQAQMLSQQLADIQQRITRLEKGK